MIFIKIIMLFILTLYLFKTIIELLAYYNTSKRNPDYTSTIDHGREVSSSTGASITTKRKVVKS